MGAVKGLIAGIILAAVALLAGGVVRLHEIDSGAKVVATVNECHHVDGLHGGSTACTATWIQGGSLVGHGHVVIGSIIGVGNGDVHKNVRARVHGGSAYTHSLATPIALFSVTGFLLVVAVWLFWMMRTGRAYGPAKRAEFEAAKAAKAKAAQEST